MNSESQSFLETLKHNRLTDVLLWLKNEAVDVNATDENANTGLMLAVIANHSNIVEAILKHTKLEINQKNQFQQTALHKAAEYARLDSIKAILAHREVDPNCRNSVQATPLHVALDNGMPENIKSVQPLLGSPTIEVNAKTRNGRVVLTIAVEAINNEALVHLPLEDPQTILDYKHWLEYVKTGSQSYNGARKFFISTAIALLQHTRINKHTVNAEGALELFKSLLTHNSKPLMRQAVVAGLDIKTNYDAYYRLAADHYKAQDKTDQLMASLTQVQTNITAALTTLFKGLGEDISQEQGMFGFKICPYL